MGLARAAVSAGDEAQSELAGRPADAMVEAEEREPGHVVRGNQRARQMNGVKRAQGLGREWHARALDHFAVEAS